MVHMKFGRRQGNPGYSFCRIYHFEIAVNSYVPDIDDVSLAWDLDLVKLNYSHYGPCEIGKG